MENLSQKYGKLRQSTKNPQWSEVTRHFDQHSTNQKQVKQFGKVKGTNDALCDLNVYRNWGILRVLNAKWKAWVGGRVCWLLRLSRIVWDYWTAFDAILYWRGPPLTLTYGCYSVGIGSVIYSKFRSNSVGVAEVGSPFKLFRTTKLHVTIF
jgi:hypothetical protein